MKTVKKIIFILLLFCLTQAGSIVFAMVGDNCDKQQLVTDIEKKLR